MTELLSFEEWLKTLILPKEMHNAEVLKYFYRNYRKNTGDVELVKDLKDLVPK